MTPRLLGLALLAAACAAPPSTARRGRPAAGPLEDSIAPGVALYGPEPAAVPTALERAAAEALRGALPPGAVRPATSGSLTLAARDIARRAAAGEPDAMARTRVRAALATGLAVDPAPVVVLLASPARDAAAALSSRASSIAGQTHIGVGAAIRGATAWLVLLASRRLAALEAFPREVRAGALVSLRGRLRGLVSPKVFVTLPSGQVREVAAAGHRDFRAEIAFESVGRYLVEVVGSGPTGPAVAALFAVSAGGAPLEEIPEAASPPEPPDPLAAEAQVLAAVNATRRRHGLPPLEPRAELAAEARRHSERMLAAGELAHTLSGHGDVGDRLRRARIPFRRAAENIALGRTALAAHAAVEESPGHRANLLDARLGHGGAGIARGRLPGGEPVVYLTEILVAPVDDASQTALTPEGRVKDLLWAERSRLGRPPLLSDPKLDELARQAARAMLSRGEPAPGDLGERALALGRGMAAVDSYVAASPEGALRSANLADDRFRRVGVGVAVGDAPGYGAGLLWIAVLYTD